MKLKTKLILIFISAAAAGLSLFGYTLYLGATNFIATKEVNTLSNFAQTFLSQLPSSITKPTSLPDLQEAVSQQNNENFIAIIIDKNGKVLSTGPLTNPITRQIDDLPLHKMVEGHDSGGYFFHQNKQFFWSLTRIPKTSYNCILITAVKGQDFKNITSLFASYGEYFVLIVLIVLGAAVWGALKVTDLLEQIDKQKKILSQNSLYDELTGLPNRTLLLEQLKQHIKCAKREGKTFALCYLDLIHFKDINNNLGREYGDKILKKIAGRLQNFLRTSDIVARLGSDEFAVFLHNINEENINIVSKKILAVLDESFMVNGHNLYVRGNLGITLYPHHGNNVQTLLTHADMALYVAKSTHSSVTVYDKKHDDYSVKRLAFINDLRNAIHKNNLEIHYQPKICLKTDSVIGIEALLRWNHPKYGFIPPDEFIPIAEQTGLINPLTQWLLNQTLEDCKSLHRCGYHINLAVNISVYNLQDNKLEREIINKLSKWDVPPVKLELEITESAMMSNPVRAMEILNAFDNLGIRLAVDDFGTGYSSLMYLKKLPVDEIKIDKSFVFQMIHNENDATIVRTTIDLAHDLGLKVVAEGVEDQETLNMLVKMKCDIAQGFHISKPLPFEELIKWLGKSNVKRIDSGNRVIGSGNVSPDDNATLEYGHVVTTHDD